MTEAINESVLTMPIKTEKRSEHFFETKNVHIINENLLETKAIPANSIDLIVTSPPYNLDIRYNSHDDTIYNHGTKFRLRQDKLSELYEESKVIV